MADWRGSDGFDDVPCPSASGTAGIGPYPDHLLGDLAEDAQGPGARYTPRESISMAFVAALRHLPPSRRAALVLCDVIGFGPAEAAEILDSSTDAVDAALAEARTVLAARLPPGGPGPSTLPGSAREREVASRFSDAFERGDADGIVALLTDDAWLTSPPVPFRYRGRAAAQFLSARQFRDGTRRFRLVATRANGQPAFGCYLSDPVAPVARVHSLLVLTLDGDLVSGITRFTDHSVLRLFGLPATLPD
jgi:RNA polymerase sigma-70 factor (ECF subfamily)